MADTATCDLCGADLLGAPVRYRAEVRIWAAYDVMELSPADLRRDLAGEIADCLKRLRSADPAESTAAIAEIRRFDLCDACRRKWRAELPEGEKEDLTKPCAG